MSHPARPERFLRCKTMKNKDKSRSGGAAFKISLAAFALLFTAATALSLLSGCGVSERDVNTPGAVPSPSVTDDYPEITAEATAAPVQTPAPAQPPALSPSPSPEPPAQTYTPAAPQSEPASGSAADVGANLSVTVPESAPVDESYFDGAVFVGDSRTEGLKMYSGLTGAKFFSSVGLSVDKVFTDPVVSLNGQTLTVADALRQAEYDKVYIMFGLNELGWVYESVFAGDYGRIIDAIRESHPDAEIYVQSIIPVSRWKDGSSDIYTNANVVRLQTALCRMCEEKGVNYVNVAEVMQDADGYLPSDATPDGVHLTPEYCRIWVDYLKTHTA